MLNRHLVDVGQNLLFVERGAKKADIRYVEIIEIMGLIVFVSEGRIKGLPVLAQRGIGDPDILKGKQEDPEKIIPVLPDQLIDVFLDA